MYKEGEIDFSEVTTFNLDEYYNLPPEAPQSYHYYMKENFFKHVNIHPARTHIPDGMAGDVEAECQDYEEKIRRSGGD